MWNYIYAPAEYGPILPVSRAWNFVKFSVNLDWAFASRVGIAAQLDDAWPPAQAKGTLLRAGGLSPVAQGPLQPVASAHYRRPAGTSSSTGTTSSPRT